MEFIIRFSVFALFTFAAAWGYEKWRKNEVLLVSLYFVIAAVIFLI